VNPASWLSSIIIIIIIIIIIYLYLHCALFVIGLVAVDSAQK
jgi:hypothetical protein